MRCRIIAIACFAAVYQECALDEAEHRLFLQDDLAIQQQWFVNGKHYSRTLEAWLAKMDAQKDSIMPIFKVLSKHAAT